MNKQDIKKGTDLIKYLKFKLKENPDAFGNTELYNVLGYEEFDSDDFGVGEIKKVHEWGGEGKGEECGITYYFKELNIYLELSGYYSSWEGREWTDDPYEVFPSIEIKKMYAAKKPDVTKFHDTLDKVLSTLYDEK